VDQTQNKGWVGLGTYAMSIGEKRSVSLGDNTGESSDLRRKVAYDAIRVVPNMPAPVEEPLPAEASTDLPIPPDPTTSADELPAVTNDGEAQTTQVRVDSGCNGMGAGASWFFLIAVLFRRRS